MRGTEFEGLLTGPRLGFLPMPGRLALLLVTIAAVLAACPRANAATMLINPKYVPRDFPINVVVDGAHGFHRVVHRRVLLHLPAGPARVTVRAEKFKHAYHGIPAGSWAYPNSWTDGIRPAKSFTFTRGPDNSQMDIAKAVYGTIISSKTIALHVQPLSVIGLPTNPTAILIGSQGAKALQPGDVVAQAASEQLPAGLFDRVTRIHSTQGGVEIGLVPATLTEAFPALKFRVKVPLTGVLSMPQLFPAGELAALCPGLPSGSTFEATGGITSELRFVGSQRFNSRMTGEVVLEPEDDFGTRLSLPSAAQCALDLDAGALRGTLDIMGIPLAVTGHMALKASFQSAGAASGQIESKRIGAVGMKFGYGPPTALGSLHRQALKGSTSNGSLLLEPELNIGVGPGETLASVSATQRISVSEPASSQLPLHFQLLGHAASAFSPRHYSVNIESEPEQFFR